MVRKIPELSIGADPELFLWCNKTNQYISGHGLIPGTKHKPYSLKKGAVQLDGVALEFNINPATTPKEFKDNIISVLGEIRAMVPEQYSFVASPTAFFKKETWSLVPKECKVLGCDPDMNIFNLEDAPPPEAKGEWDMGRTASGHIHLGWTRDQDINCPHHRFDCQVIARRLEQYNSVFEYFNGSSAKQIKQERDRKTLYGNGTMRIKPYGLEWRSPSNSWLLYPDLFPLIFSSIKGMFKDMVQDTWDGNPLYYLDHFIKNRLRYAPEGAPKRAELKKIQGYLKISQKEIDSLVLPLQSKGTLKERSINYV